MSVVAAAGLSAGGIAAVTAAAVGAFATLLVGVLNLVAQRRVLASQKEQQQAQLEQAREQVKILRDGQVNQLFVNAIAHLGHATVDVRIGGLYALEGIAGAYPDYREQALEILASYVQGHAPWPPRAGSGSRQPPVDLDLGNMNPLHGWAADVQAAMTVICRWEHRVPETELNLDMVDLRFASMEKANLHCAVMRRSALMRAMLHEAKLPDAKLSRADLRGADLRNVDLRGAVLIRANLWSADLGRADLSGADLRNANLTGAIYQGANFDGAKASSRTQWPEGLDVHSHGIIFRNCRPESPAGRPARR